MHVMVVRATRKSMLKAIQATKKFMHQFQGAIFWKHLIWAKFPDQTWKTKKATLMNALIESILWIKIFIRSRYLWWPFWRNELTDWLWFTWQKQLPQFSHSNYNVDRQNVKNITNSVWGNFLRWSNFFILNKLCVIVKSFVCYFFCDLFL